MRYESFRTAFFLYTLLFAVLTAPYWGLGEVVAPYRQFSELAMADHTGAQQIENRKFADFGNGYIPEVNEHLKGSRSGWLTLWINQNELGRPVYQISGFSPAYLLSWVITHLTDNPWRFITLLSLFTCYLGGAFVLGFSRETGLAPLAGLVAGGSLAASPPLLYWLTFPMFPAIWCWAAGALWGVTRLARKPDLLGWSLLAFSVYSLLMTAYPQPVVFHAYILTGYGLCLAYRKQQATGWAETGRFLMLSASAVVLGAAMSLPVYLDLAHLSAESARVASDASFFTAVLPKLASFADAVRFFVVSTTPEIFGNPITATYPFPYDGLSITPLVVFLALVGLLAAFRQTWGWWLTIVVLCLLAFVHPLYVLGVKYFGFNLSRSTPIGSIMLPLIIITAYGVDAMVRRSLAHRERSRMVLMATAGTLAVVAVGLGFGLSLDMALRWRMVMAMLCAVGLLAAQYRRPHPGWLFAALTIVGAMISFPLMLRQDPARVATTSPLVEKVRANLPAGSRFAVAAPGLPVLPPNLNASLGLPSVHSYNSLSSRRYHTLIKALGGEVQTYGRWNGMVAPDYDSTMFWMSNIGLVLSPTKLVHGNLEYLGEEAGVHLHKVSSRMGDSLQIPVPEPLGTDEVPAVDPRRTPGHQPTKSQDLGDALEFVVKPGSPSILVLSQKFHRDWRAQVYGRSCWVPAKTVVVNGVFQGVLLPEGTERVRLEFKPFARFAWVAHGFWLVLLSWLGFHTWQRQRQWASRDVWARETPDRTCCCSSPALPRRP
jgi:hypothetical protein